MSTNLVIICIVFLWKVVITMSRNSKIIWNIALICYIIGSVISGVYVLLSDDKSRGWFAFAGIGFVFLPFILTKLFKVKSSYLLNTEILIFLFLAFQLGSICRWYEKYAYYDIFVHGLCGLLVTQLGLCLGWRLSNGNKSINNLLIAFSAAFSLSCSEIWEIYEYCVFELIGRDMQKTMLNGTKDTMEDMIICLVGTIIMSVMIKLHLSKKYKRFSLKPLDEFYNINFAN